MSKLRSVNTHFWSDTYIVDLDPIEKLLFLYLLTNENTNMLGIYEIHIRRISFDTGIDKDMVKKIFDRFEQSGKAKYVDGYVILQNFLKHQSFNTNMETSARQTWNQLPSVVREDEFCQPVYKALKAFGKTSEPITEIEYEYEIEYEKEIDKSVGTSEADDFPDVCEFLDESKEIAQYLLEAIKEYDPTHKYNRNPPSLQSWILDIERAMRLDGRTEKQLKFIIDYVYRHNGKHSAFWAGNIESGKKLRKQFDKIKNQIRAEQKNGQQKTKGDKRAEILRNAERDFQQVMGVSEQ